MEACLINDVTHTTCTKELGPFIWAVKLHIQSSAVLHILLDLGFFANISNIPCSELYLRLLSPPLALSPALPSLLNGRALHPTAEVGAGVFEWPSVVVLATGASLDESAGPSHSVLTLPPHRIPGWLVFQLWPWAGCVWCVCGKQEWTFRCYKYKN